MKDASSRRRSRAAHSANGTSALDKELVTLPIGPEGLLITRRNFLYGVGAVAVVAAVGGGARAVMGAVSDDGDLDVLTVPESAVTASTSLEEMDANSAIVLKAYTDLPFGSLIWADNPTVAACLIPTDTASPLTSVSVMYLHNASTVKVLNNAVGKDEGFEIYDVRASEDGLIWTEANILAGVWRIYTATLKDATLGDPVLADEGDRNWRTPSIAAVEHYGYWQVMPNLDGEHARDDSILRKVKLGTSRPQDILTSTGRMATAVYPVKDGVVVTPRTDTNSVHYQLTKLDLKTDEVVDSMILPQGMRPLEAGYGNNGFMFSFDAIYNYGDGIANLGTYTPLRKVEDGAYSNAPWFTFVRTPTAPPCWCGKYFIVKSTTATCGVDMESKTYFAIKVPEGAEDYGEYLASTGTGNLLVTYANIDYKPIEGDPVKTCQVRVWETV